MMHHLHMLTPPLLDTFWGCIGYVPHSKLLEETRNIYRNEYLREDIAQNGRFTEGNGREGLAIPKITGTCPRNLHK